MVFDCLLNALFERVNLQTIFYLTNIKAKKAIIATKNNEKAIRKYCRELNIKAVFYLI